MLTHGHYGGGGCAPTRAAGWYFQCGHDDAASLAREFAALDATALLSLARFEAAARLSIDGHTSAPFTLRTLPPAPVPERSVREEIIVSSRKRYGTPVAEVDAALELALGKSSVSVKPLGDEVVTSWAWSPLRPEGELASSPAPR